jgi:myo-inositol-1(or 4)-monophosphatase
MFGDPNISVEYKAKKEIVTSADKGSEKILLEYLQETYPEHKIISEENGICGNKKSEYVWYIDPLDGTSNFYHHIPYFNVSVALQHKDEILCGAVYNPITEETFYAEKNGGAFLNGTKIMGSKCEKLSDAFITACHGRNDNEIAMFLKFMGQFKYKAKDMRKLGSAALELCYVASGRADAFIGYGIRPWDFKAGLIIAIESGCKVGGINAEKIEESNLLVSGSKIYPEIRKVIDTELNSKKY